MVGFCVGNWKLFFPTMFWSLTSANNVGGNFSPRKLGKMNPFWLVYLKWVSSTTNFTHPWVLFTHQEFWYIIGDLNELDVCVRWLGRRMYRTSEAPFFCSRCFVSGGNPPPAELSRERPRKIWKIFRGFPLQEMKIITTEKWWLEDYFPMGKANF